MGRRLVDRVATMMITLMNPKLAKRVSEMEKRTELRLNEAHKLMQDAERTSTYIGEMVRVEVARAAFRGPRISAENGHG